MISVERTISGVHSLPELTKSHESKRMKIFRVHVGEYVFNDNSRPYVSGGFYCCSAYLMKAKDQDIFGLFHAAPFQSLKKKEIKDFKVFSGGQLILIEGTANLPKHSINETLRNKVDLIPSRVISIQTVKFLSECNDFTNEAFSVVYRPKSDTIILARESHHDLQVYPGFNS
jgi:hypothetical protein